MSIVNLKIIFVKKQKQTREQWRERPTQGRGATFIYNRNGRFHTRGALFVWMNNPPDFISQLVNFDGQFIRSDYPFQIAYVKRPPPLRKNRRRGVWG